MNTLFCARSLKLEEMEAEVSSTKICREENFSVQYEQVLEFFKIILLIFSFSG
jgi:hypothetical protein